MTTLDLRATRLDLANEVTDATSIAITFLEGAEPADLSAWTFTAPILTLGGTAADDDFTVAVDANVVTLTLAAEALTQGSYLWGLVATTAGSAATWLAGSFVVGRFGTTARRTTSPVTVELDVGVTVTATINVGGAGGEAGTVISVNGDTGVVVLGAADVGADATGTAAAAIAAHVAAVDPHPQYLTAAEGNAAYDALGSAAAAQAASQPLDADLTALAAAGNSAVLAATTASFLTADETKLDGIAAGAEVNVQSDWDAVAGDALILNKPTLGTAAAADTGDFATAAQGALADTATQPADLAAYTPKARTIGTQAGATYTLAASDVYTYLRLTNASPDLTVPDDGDVSWPVGGWVEIFASGGPITFIEDTSVTINVAAGQSLIGEDAGSGFTLIKVAAQTWDLVGRLAAA